MAFQFAGYLIDAATKSEAAELMKQYGYNLTKEDIRDYP